MKKLGEILIEHGALTSEQLKKALEKQNNQPGQRIGEILIEMGMITEDDIVVALATQFNMPYLPVENYSVNEAVQGLLPEKMIRACLCAPLDKVGDLLTIVMADPTNVEGIKEIEKESKCQVQTFVSKRSEIKKVLKSQFGIDIDSNSDKKGSQSSSDKKSNAKNGKPSS